MDKAKMLELFGSDSEEEEEEGKEEAPVWTSASRPLDDDDTVGEDDLFGGDSDEEPQAAAEPPLPQVPSAEPLHYELPKVQCPPEDENLYLVKMPNIVKIQPRPFESTNPECLAGELGDSGRKNAYGEPLYEMGGANIIRWRFNPETGGRQSNARIVRWSDGSMTLHVGSEVLAAPVQKMTGGKTQLFAFHKGGNLECHGRFDQRMLFQPVSIDSSTHRALTKKIAQEVQSKPKRGIMMTATTEDPEKKKLAEERAWEEQRRLQHRQASRRRSAEEYRDAPTLSADFLEADDDVEEGNIGAIKRRFKDQRNRRARGGVARGGARKRNRYYRNDDEAEDDDDDDDEMDDSAWDREERRAAESGEMDDFIADDDDEEESAEESDEFGGMDDDDDDDEPVKPKKKR